MSANDIAMLSAQNATIDDIRFPCDVSVKLDGIRCLTIKGKAMSRANIPLPNLFLQSKIAATPMVLDLLDGELIIGDPAAEDCYNKTQSGISKVGGEPAFTYYVFDDLRDPSLPFEERQRRLRHRFMVGELPSWCILVQQRRLDTKEQLVSLYAHLVEEGHEGVITRNPLSPYKRGRGTIKAQDMIKLKPREDSEFKVIGIVEQEHNANEAFKGERGQTKRSSAKSGMLKNGTLGKLLARDIHSGVEFKIGTFKGLTAKDKQRIFDFQDEFVGKEGVYSFCPVGVKTLPRQPSFKAWGRRIDLPA